jgi:hypothetical protein
MTPVEFEATLTWANGVTQVEEDHAGRQPFGAVLKADGQRNGSSRARTAGSTSTAGVASKPFTGNVGDSNVWRIGAYGGTPGNFFDAVRSRKDPVSPVEAGHLSATVGHLIVIALQTGRPLRWDPSAQKFVGDGAKDANARQSRQMRKPYDYHFAG